MFLPLSLSIGFAMIVSFIAAQTLVPVISNWLLKEEMFQYHHRKPHAHAGLALDEKEMNEITEHNKQDKKHPEENDFFQRIKMSLGKPAGKMDAKTKAIVIVYLILCIGCSGHLFVVIGKDLLPKTNNGQLQLRIKEPDGTRLEVTEREYKGILDIIDSTVDGNVVDQFCLCGLGTEQLWLQQSLYF